MPEISYHQVSEARQNAMIDRAVGSSSHPKPGASRLNLGPAPEARHDKIDSTDAIKLVAASLQPQKKRRVSLHNK